MSRLLLSILSVLVAAGLVTVKAGDGVRVSLITCGPGSDVYELEGHTALRLTDSVSGSDVAVHWGLFDFESPGFLYRFVKGETDYSVGTIPFALFVSAYRQQGREVTEQELDLTPEQALRLRYLVEENLRPENRVYRYNYVKDNCATRPLRLIETAIGDTLSVTDSRDSMASTFRSEMTRFHRNYPWYQFGIDLALGQGIDYEINDREKTFAPVTLCRLLADVTVSDSAGLRRPLVKDTAVLVPAGYDLASAPTPWYQTPLTVSVLLLFLAVAVTVRDIRRRRVSRWFDSLYYGVAGISGLVLTFLIFVSVHEATSPNWLYLWLNPLCLVAAVGVWLKKYNRIVFYCQIVNFVALILLSVVACFGVQVLNNAFISLILCDMIRSINYIYITECERKKID